MSLPIARIAPLGLTLGLFLGCGDAPTPAVAPAVQGSPVVQEVPKGKAKTPNTPAKVGRVSR